MNKNSHTADALREILATCADPLNRACEEYAKLERELAEVRAALAGEDFASLPSDFPTVRMAHTIRSERDKFLWQVRDTCARAEKAESAASETRRTYEDGLNAVQRELDLVVVEYENEESLIQHLTDRIIALKKADPQVPETTGTQDRDSTAPPVGSAPCVAAAPGEHWNIRAAFVNRVTKEVSVKFGSLAEAEQFQKHCLDLMGNHERKEP